ncbi:nitrogenase component 1 [Lachnospiraceae bacterium ZAX-1]
MGGNLREFYKNAYLYNRLPYAHSFTPSGKAAGAIYTFSSMRDVIPILHGSAGCGYHYRYLCRMNGTSACDLHCTNLNEYDIAMGGEEKLRATILDVALRLKPVLIAVIPTTPIEMIGADVERILAELRPTVPCHLIFVSSEGISHADKRHIGNDAFIRPQERCGDTRHFDESLRGCGFSDAMKAMVTQVMKSQETQINAVNLCGLFWEGGGQALLGGVIKELIAMGIEINSILPGGKIEDIENAPKAVLNIMTRRINWAVKMKEVFGTDYFRIDQDRYAYEGLDGIEHLYLDIAERLRLSHKAASYLRAKRHKTERILSEAGAAMDGHSCVLCVDDYRNISKFLRFYRDVLKFNIEHVLIKVRAKGYTSIYAMEKLVNFADSYMNAAVKEAGHSIKWLVNPNKEQSASILKQTEYIVGSDCFVSGETKYKYISPPCFIPLDFDNFGHFLLDYVNQIKRLPLRRLSENSIQNATEDCADTIRWNAISSLMFWDKMWIQRS